MRIVAHTCSNTEIVCALGCADWLVGVDDHSDFPADVVAGLPRVGPDLTVDIERIQALSPDLVLTSLTLPGHEIGLARMRAAGLPVLVMAPRSIADVLADIGRIADAIGVPERGRKLTEELEAGLLRVSAPKQRPAILVEWWPKPVIVPGQQSWVNDLIERAGGINPMAGEPVESAPVTDQQVIDWAPEAVVIAWCGVPFEKYRREVVKRRIAWQNLPALRNDRIYRVSEAWLGRPGPRLSLGLKALKAIVEEIQAASQ